MPLRSRRRLVNRLEYLRDRTASVTLANQAQAVSEDPLEELRPQYHHLRSRKTWPTGMTRQTTSSRSLPHLEEVHQLRSIRKVKRLILPLLQPSAHHPWLGVPHLQKQEWDLHHVVLALLLEVAPRATHTRRRNGQDPCLRHRQRMHLSQASNHSLRFQLPWRRLLPEAHHRTNHLHLPPARPAAIDMRLHQAFSLRLNRHPSQHHRRRTRTLQGRARWEMHSTPLQAPAHHHPEQDPRQVVHLRAHLETQHHQHRRRHSQELQRQLQVSTHPVIVST